jgi:hypothetical protein
VSEREYEIIELRRPNGNVLLHFIVAKGEAWLWEPALPELYPDGPVQWFVDGEPRGEPFEYRREL